MMIKQKSFWVECRSRIRNAYREIETMEDEMVYGEAIDQDSIRIIKRQLEELHLSLSSRLAQKEDSIKHAMTRSHKAEQHHEP